MTTDNKRKVRETKYKLMLAAYPLTSIKWYILFIIICLALLFAVEDLVIHDIVVALLTSGFFAIITELLNNYYRNKLSCIKLEAIIQ